MAALRNFNGLASWKNAENSLQSVNLTMPFVAMWFDPSMNDAWEKGFRLAVHEAGYDPLRIDRTEHVNKICDEIVAQIRRARFVVADFTHGDSGARGGVYYEAGFAHGLDIPGHIHVPGRYVRESPFRHTPIQPHRVEGHGGVKGKTGKSYRRCDRRRAIPELIPAGHWIDFCERRAQREKGG